MKVSYTGDVRIINWEAIAEGIKLDAIKGIVAALDEAAKVIPILNPGERRVIRIDVGVIEISREP